MEPGAIERGVDVEPVAAYPRAALDQYLAEARLIADDLRRKISIEERRRDVALLALDRAAEAHRTLGAMLVSATAELGGRRSRAERDAEAIAEGDGDPGERFGHLPPPPGLHAVPDLADAPYPDLADAPYPDLAELASTDPAEGRGDGATDVDAPGIARLARFDAPWLRPRAARRREEAEAWPYNEAAGDESFFVRLRDELRADGSLTSWFEPA